jgi:hypothetical protein
MHTHEILIVMRMYMQLGVCLIINGGNFFIFKVFEIEQSDLIEMGYRLSSPEGC